MSRLVIIDGKPGSGKSTLAGIIHEKLGVPVVSKDGIKEYLFDTLGSKDREWSQTVGAASMEMLYASWRNF
jgi:predicted kinase